MFPLQTSYVSLIDVDVLTFISENYRHISLCYPLFRSIL